MNEKRFITIDHSTCVFDKITKEEYVCIDREEAFLVCKRLNEQQDTIITLKRRLEKINGCYGHLTYRSGLTANEWLIESQERELKKKNEQISNLKEENEQLRTQLLICQQSKNDDGRFQVWEIPPITSGMRVSTTTINNEQKRDSK